MNKVNMNHFFLKSKYSYINKNDNKFKKVNFNKYVTIIFIPNIEFISSKNLIQYLWWNNEDLKIFRQESLLEIKTLINRNPTMQINDATKLLYQPNNITFNKENF